MSLRALIVDDSAALRKSLCFALESISGLVCVEAKNGVEGLKVVSAGDRFDLIVTDLQMPQLDGLKLIRAVRENLHQSTVPILVMSAQVLESERQRILSMGVSGIVYKPLQFDDVVMQVKRLLQLELL